MSDALVIAGAALSLLAVAFAAGWVNRISDDAAQGRTPMTLAADLGIASALAVVAVFCFFAAAVTNT